jgi:hypothetical protein
METHGMTALRQLQASGQALNVARLPFVELILGLLPVPDLKGTVDLILSHHWLDFQFVKTLALQRVGDSLTHWWREGVYRQGVDVLVLPLLDHTLLMLLQLLVLIFDFICGQHFHTPSL